MTEYILDVSKWRCGSSGNYKLGQGDTLLLNNEGYSCCLGQFAMQMNVPPEVCLGLAEPASLAASSKEVDNYDSTFVTKFDKDINYYNNSMLSYKLMTINDENCSSASEKISRIREELEKAGHTLKVINGESYNV